MLQRNNAVLSCLNEAFPKTTIKKDKISFINFHGPILESVCIMITMIYTFLTVLVFCKSVYSADPIVQLPNGLILGRQATTFAKTEYYAFQKIPYAAPPVGKLRFQAPQPALNWDGIRNGTTLDVSCYQVGINSPTDSEDCLFLNVFTPNLSDGPDLLPIMLYIHGGGFMIGSSIELPPDLFIDNGVILVTINYRLGFFGFLSTQDEIIPGNNGLKDQKLAIEWTKENIELFGGDPDKITIFGESAGGASVGYHLLNQDSAGLFWGGILESGTSLNPGVYQRDSRNIAFGTASVLNSTFANSDNSNDLLDFFLSLEASELDAAAEEYVNQVSNIWDSHVYQGCIFAPVLEVKNPDAFITRKMYGLLKAGSAVAVPIMVGFNSEENLIASQDPVLFQTIVEALDDDLDLIVPNNMQITDPEKHSEMAKSIRDIYTGGQPFGTRLGDALRYSSDNGFTRGAVKFAEFFSSVAATYFYQFSYDGILGGFNAHYDGAENVGHTEELSYLFCADEGCDFSQLPEYEGITANRMIKLWTNFAKYQNPTPEASDLFQNISWPKVNTEEGDFLYLDINENLEIRNHPKAETLSKWNELYESLDFDDFDTY